MLNMEIVGDASDRATADVAVVVPEWMVLFASTSTTGCCWWSCVRR